jgi:hypothetical protein
MWRARGVSSPRPRSRSSRATSGWPAKALERARATLEAHGDRVNAAHARISRLRRLLLIGRLDEAERSARRVDPRRFPPRRGRPRAGGCRDRDAAPATKAARARSPGRARARRGAFRRLTAEVESASLCMTRAAARLIARGEERPLLLDGGRNAAGVEALVVDAAVMSCAERRTRVSLATRPVCSRLPRAGEAWPGDVPRGTLLAPRLPGEARR